LYKTLKYLTIALKQLTARYTVAYRLLERPGWYGRFFAKHFKNIFSRN